MSEETVIVPEFKFTPKQLTDEQSKNFISLYMSRQNEKLIQEAEELKGDFGAKVLIKRLEAYELPFEITDFFYVASVMTFIDRVGVVVIMLRLCWQEWKKMGRTRFDIQAWGETMFPMGVPGEEDLEKMWDSQKGHALGFDNIDNVLDAWEPWHGPMNRFQKIRRAKGT